MVAGGDEVNPRAAKAKGRTWENAIVDYLIDEGWPHAERRRLTGALDKGDIAGVPGVCIEAKNAKAINLASFVDQANHEGINANAAVSVAWVKRRGRISAADGYVVMDGAMFTRLLRQAGWQ